MFTTNENPNNFAPLGATARRGVLFFDWSLGYPMRDFNLSLRKPVDCPPPPPNQSTSFATYAAHVPESITDATPFVNGKKIFQTWAPHHVPHHNSPAPSSRNR